MRVAAAQLNPVVGDLEGNVSRILAALSTAESLGAQVCVFPELAITGYPPEDLLLKPGFVADNVAALGEVARATARCLAVVGYVAPLATASRTSDGGGPALANAAAVCLDGRVVGEHHKRILPNYGVFDERRWFVPGSGPLGLYRLHHALVGVSICEDVWSPDGPVPLLGRAGADLVVNVNASPYSRGRRAERLEMLVERAAQAGCPIVYVNQVGGQDELVFDGASLVVGSDGAILASALQFREDLLVVDLTLEENAGGAELSEGHDRGVEVRETGSGAEDTRSTAMGRAATTPSRPTLPSLPLRPAVAPLDDLAEIYEALVLGTGDYLAKNGFTDAVVGLSGGVDSALVATVAADALGAGHVHALAMPSSYSSEGSLSDAALVAERLGIDLQVLPIEPAHEAICASLVPVLGQAPRGVTDENLQSRLRGVLLMAFSNATGSIVLTTGNKSEMATGYSTLYGDSAGGFAVIKDVPKTLVYELCRYRNRRDEASGGTGPIPASVLAKPPSAELRPDQRDDQSLPPYERLDPVLAAYVEGDLTSPQLIEAGYDPAIVDQVVRLVDGAEYKRRQMPPGVRISVKAFGKDRRMPITNHYMPARVARGARAARGAPSTAVADA